MKFVQNMTGFKTKLTVPAMKTSSAHNINQLSDSSLISVGKTVS